MSDWRNNLNSFFEESNKEEVQDKRSEIEVFVADIAMPAFEEIASELRSHGREVLIRESEAAASILVQKDGEEELSYSLQGRMFPSGILPYSEIRYRERGGRRLITIEGTVRNGPQDYPITDITKEELIERFIKEYTSRVKLD